MIRQLTPLAVALAVALPAVAQEPITDNEALALLRSTLPADRYKALEYADRVGWRASAEFKALLVERAGQVMREEIEFHDEHEGVFAWVNAVIRTHNPDAIPFLIEHGMGYGGIPANAVADFGELALPHLLDFITPKEGENPNEVSVGFRVLRFMIEDGLMTPEIREAVQVRLTGGQQDWNVVRYAMMAAVALGDPELLRRVETLSSVPDELVALLGNEQIVEYSGPRPLVVRMMSDARRFLSGDLMSGPRRLCWTGDCPPAPRR